MNTEIAAFLAGVALTLMVLIVIGVIYAAGYRRGEFDEREKQQ